MAVNFMQNLLYCFPYHIRNIDCSSTNAETRTLVALTIAERRLNVPAAYVEDCFVRYPRVSLFYRREKIVGAFFYNHFSHFGDEHYYFGPMFFISRPAFAICMTKMIRIFLKNSSRIFILAEVQNPELIIHMHSIFGGAITPSPFTFHINDQAKDRLKIFCQHVSQMDDVLVDKFVSHGRATLYSRNNTTLVSEWLLMHGVNLEQNHALIMLVEITPWRFLLTQIKILSHYLTYPRHKSVYLRKLACKMRDNP